MNMVHRMQGTVAELMAEFEREEKKATDIHVKLYPKHQVIDLTLEDNMIKRYIFPIESSTVTQETWMS